MIKQYILFLLIIITLLSCKTDKNTHPKVNTLLPENPHQAVVLDISNLFIPSEKEDLTIKIIDFEKRSENQIAILTIDSIKPYNDIKQYGNDVCNYWGVGKKDKDNGLVIVVCKPCRKVALSTGYSTEQILTDSICKSIIENTIIPHFKEDAFYKGIDKALDSIIKKWN